MKTRDRSVLQCYVRNMDEHELLQRLTMLSQPWCSYELVHQLLGIDLSTDAKLVATVLQWSVRFRNEECFRQVPGEGLQVDRFALETFLTEERLISNKWAAVQLGMDEKSFVNMTEKMKEKGWGSNILSSVSDQLVLQREAALSYRLFPSLRHRTFSNHSSKCRALHDAARAELAIQIESLFCVTSAVLDQDGEVDLAGAFDAVSLDPTGLRYQVWLNTNKPINLAPDVCSLKFYGQHQRTMAQHAMQGSEPKEIDARLRAA
jgi:hypothetical protein